MSVIDRAADTFDFVGLVPVLLFRDDDREGNPMLLCHSDDCFGILGVDDLSKDSQPAIAALQLLEFLQIRPKVFVFEVAKRDHLAGLAGVGANLAILLAVLDVLDFVRRQTVAGLQTGVRQTRHR